MANANASAENGGSAMSRDRSSATGITTDFSDIKFVFLDRDGVINRKPPKGEYVTSWEEVQMLPGAERAIALLNQSRRKVIVVTNQRGIALGRLSESELLAIHENLGMHLGSCGAHVDAIYFCPHDHGQCGCRKPGTGLFERAFRDLPGARPENSVMIGDSDSDIVAGTRVGMKTILITQPGNSRESLTARPTASGRSLLEVVETHLS
jgi:D-glycero-D-manno-heptose 1,7-bisphosphate phosphatase